MKWRTCLTGAGLALLAGALAWREYAHAGTQQLLRDHAEETSTQLNETREQLALESTALEACTAESAALSLSLQSQRDRTSNLEAQRDHLRAEISRQTKARLASEETVQRLRVDLETARSRMLDLTRQPSELEGQLHQATAQIRLLEASLDAQSRIAAGAPVPWTFSGLSRDRTVFAVEGTLPEGMQLPLPVAVCDREKVLLYGWLQRAENGHLIGHVAGSSDPASTLVKGKKVFILRRPDHETQS